MDILPAGTPGRSNGILKHKQQINLCIKGPYETLLGFIETKDNSFSSVDGEAKVLWRDQK